MAKGRLRGLLALAILLQPRPAATEGAEALACGLEPGPTRAVAQVLDGETVKLDDGLEVRLIGALAPRAADAGALAGSWPPEEEARQALGRLVDGRSVALAFGGRRQDRYGRVLAHLFLTGNPQMIWVQGALLEAGHARAYSLPDNESCIAGLLERERRARAAGRGLWAHAAYQVRPADRPDELALYRDTFQLVFGRIERVARGRDGMTAFFQASAEGGALRRVRRPVAVRWPKAAARSPEGTGPNALVGRDILVRGWVGQRLGPLIEIVSAGQIDSAAPRSKDPERETPGAEAAGRP
jgi:endonuclease YncB( thermonuclease family)